MLVLLALILCALASPALAQETRRVAPGASSPRATVADAAWLAGTWSAMQDGGVFASETYSAPSGGQITGHFFETKGGRVTLMELLQVAERDGSLVYRLRHFRADFTGWEDGAGKAVEFPLVAFDRDHLWFDGFTIDRSDPKALVLWVRIKDKSGAEKEIRYRYPR